MPPQIRDNLNAREESESHFVEGCNWMPEYGAWMVEGTPSKPYTGYSNDLLRVERNMRLRRARLLTQLKPNEIVPTLSVFPQLGVGDFCSPALPTMGKVANSPYIPDGCINPHPRFAALTQNIRARRGSNVDIRVPLYQDKETPEFLAELAEAGGAMEGGFEMETKSTDGRPDIAMDAMAFGMGMCCTQITFQARDVAESRYLFDQLAVLSPIFLALTAASPIFKGRLGDYDVRWSTISGAVDDRTPTERGGVLDPPAYGAGRDEVAGEGAAGSEAGAEAGAEAEAEGEGDARMAGGGRKRLTKSRYDSISGFIYQCPGADEKGVDVNRYNDLDRAIDQWSLETLRENGIDEPLARHIAHLFVRDPLVIFDGLIEELDDKVKDM